ncbi:unnamed protein product, partial [Prunus brigantina]
LTRFISKATDRCASFFKALKGNKRKITWTAECDKAFSELKEYISRAPLLSTPELGDTFTIYLSVSATAVSLVLILPHEGAEHLVHYVSKGLQDAEVWDVGMALSLSPWIRLSLSMPSASNSTPPTMSQVPRSENSHVDALARLASAIEQGIGCNIHTEFLDEPSTQAPIICTFDHSPTWMDPILQFLQNQSLSAVPGEARHVRYRSARYLIINGALYKGDFSLPYLRCLTPEEGNYVLREIHEGICGNHSG